MTVLVVSDTHKNFGEFYDLVLQYKSKVDFVIHLGDGESDIDDLFMLEPNIPIRYVSGNCDWSSLKPSSDIVSVGGAKIFICHGHNFGVKYSLDRLALEAKRLGAQTALFGHTHRQQYTVINGVQCLNPGSLGEPRDGKRGYALIEIVNGQVNCCLKQV